MLDTEGTQSTGAAVKTVINPQAALLQAVTVFCLGGWALLGSGSLQRETGSEGEKAPGSLYYH